MDKKKENDIVTLIKLKKEYADKNLLKEIKQSKEVDFDKVEQKKEL